MKLIKRTVAILVAIIMSLSISVTGFAQDSSDFDYSAYLEKSSNLYKQLSLSYIYQIINFVDDYYKYDISREDLYKIVMENIVKNDELDLDSVLKDMFSSLDEYSAYFTKEEFQGFVTSVTGNLVGIGVTIVEKEGQIVIVTPIEGSPAEKVGIKPNDIIKTVNGVSVEGLSTNVVASYIRGEIGTKVKVGIKRPGIADIIEFEIVRDIIETNPVKFKILDNNIGYLNIIDFNDNTKKNVDIAISEFDKAKVEKVIIDLRNNPGGTLEAVEIFANMFLPEGVISTISYKDESMNEQILSKNKNNKYKLALLVNEGSASASELFAGAMQDMKAGRLFGTTTYGKGSVQTVQMLSNGGGFKLTIAEYLTPNGRSIHKIGVTPDEVVYNTYKFVTEDDFIKLDLSKTYSLNDSGDSVKAIKERLHYLGLLEEVNNDIYDENTKEAVSNFQIANNLEGTGICDIHTLIFLNNIIYEGYVLVDNQLEAAINYLNNL